MTTLLDITFLATGTSPSTTKWNPSMKRMTLNYKANPNDSTDTYCYLEGSLQLSIDQTIPCDEVKVVDVMMRGTHASANDVKAPFHCSIDFLKCYQVNNPVLDNSFRIEPCLNNDQARPWNPVVFSTTGVGITKKFTVRLRQVQWTDDLGSAQFGTDDAFVVSIKIQVPVERI